MWSKFFRSVRRWFRAPAPPTPVVRVDWPEPTLPYRAPPARPSVTWADGPASILLPRPGPAPRTSDPLILDATTVEIDGLSVERDVVVPDARRLTRIGRCEIAGRLIVRRCPRLTEIARDAATGGLVLDGATALRTLPSGLRVVGDLRLIGCTRLESLGDDLEVAGSLAIRGCPRLQWLPARLRVANDLQLIGKTRLDTLPATLAVAGDIVVQHAIRAIAPGFGAPASLVILGCRDLAELPDGLSVGGDLIIRRCPKLTALPHGLKIAGELEARRASLTTLPDDLRVGSHVDLDGCTQLTALPDHLVLPGGVRLRRCVALTRLPAGLITCAVSHTLGGRQAAAASLATRPRCASVGAMAESAGDTTASSPRGAVDPAHSFEPHRRYLRGLAYRMLGSVAEAEDVVQDAFLRWNAADRDHVAEPRAFLARVASRLCLDRMKSASARRERYVGTWLPEPVVGAEPRDPAALAEDLSIALLMTLERLSPLERAAFLLHDVFDMDYAQIAEVLERSEAAVRQLATRGREHVRDERPRFHATGDATARLASAFHAAMLQ
ncbi:MAG TPA: sigma-70 family RNA polymerase sigma factor, partial [Kofleriaceae bacterium]